MCGDNPHLQHAEALGAQVRGRAGGRPGGPVASQAPVLPLVVEALQQSVQASGARSGCAGRQLQVYDLPSRQGG